MAVLEVRSPTPVHLPSIKWPLPPLLHRYTVAVACILANLPLTLSLAPHALAPLTLTFALTLARWRWRWRVRAPIVHLGHSLLPLRSPLTHLHRLAPITN